MGGPVCHCGGHSTGPDHMEGLGHVTLTFFSYSRIQLMMVFTQHISRPDKKGYRDNLGIVSHISP